MLGNTISDPLHTEVADGMPDQLPGMGLLDVETVFSPDKHQTEVRGTLSGIEGMLLGLNGLEYEGYEIHMGQSFPASQSGQTISAKPILSRKNVYGTYIHGIFDAPGIVKEILEAICASKGKTLDIAEFKDIKAYRESQYNILADAVRSSLDMEYIYSIL